MGSKLSRRALVKWRTCIGGDSRGFKASWLSR